MTKLLRSLGIILLAITAVFTFLGGIGTSCVAFRAEEFGENMARLVPVKPIFQVLVVVSIAAALFGIYATILLGRNQRRAYLYALLFLVIGLAASGIQLYYSATLRGSTAPNNVRFYLTAITLLVFMLFRLPGIWQKSGFEGKNINSKQSDSDNPAGLVLFICGLVIITTPLWAAPTHIIGGINTVSLLSLPLLFLGGGMVTAGVLIHLRINLTHSFWGKEHSPGPKNILIKGE